MAERQTADDERTAADKDNDYLADVVVRDAARRVSRELSDVQEVSAVEAVRFAAHDSKSDRIDIQLKEHTSGNAHHLGFITQRIAETGAVRFVSIDTREELIQVVPSEQ